MKGKITGVSLGTGDPELITLKGLKALQQADIIFYPGSVSDVGEKDSYALRILEQLPVDLHKAKGYYLRMNGVEEEADRIYQEVYQEAIGEFNYGKSVVLVSEGDISFYSTFLYVLSKFRSTDIPVQLIPGVSSLHHAAAAGLFPLGLKEEKIVIVPRLSSSQEIDTLLQKFDTIVIIKVRSVMQQLLQFLVDQSFQCLYAERLGTPEEFLLQDLRLLNDRNIPYFSLLFIKKSKSVLH